MPVSTHEAHQRIVQELGAAVDSAALAVACLGDAFELLTTGPADRLEDQLFRPIQKGYGQAKRTMIQFADRHGVPQPELTAPSPGLASQGAKSLIEHAAAASAEADHKIAELQDSMLPIEAGDPELRQGLSEARELLGAAPVAARGFLRTLGR